MRADTTPRIGRGKGGGEKESRFACRDEAMLELFMLPVWIGREVKEPQAKKETSSAIPEGSIQGRFRMPRLQCIPKELCQALVWVDKGPDPNSELSLPCPATPTKALSSLSPRLWSLVARLSSSSCIEKLPRRTWSRTAHQQHEKLAVALWQHVEATQQVGYAAAGQHSRGAGWLYTYITGRTFFAIRFDEPVIRRQRRSTSFTASDDPPPESASLAV
jgi:hypothetical protein